MEFKQKGRQGTNPEKQTLNSFLKSWLKRRKVELKPESFELYEGTIKRLVDYFGKECSLHDITLKRVEDFILAQKNIAPGR